MFQKIVMGFGCFFCCFAICAFAASFCKMRIITHDWSPYFIAIAGAILIYISDHFDKTKKK